MEELATGTFNPMITIRKQDLERLVREINQHIIQEQLENLRIILRDPIQPGRTNPVKLVEGGITVIPRALDHRTQVRIEGAREDLQAKKVENKKILEEKMSHSSTSGRHYEGEHEGKEEHQVDKIEERRMRGAVTSTLQKKGTPFSEEILMEVVTPDFKILNLPRYEGKKDP